MALASRARSIARIVAVAVLSALMLTAVAQAKRPLPPVNASPPAVTGAPVWASGTQLPGQSAFSSPPTALGGLVYTGGAGSAGTVYGVRASDGSVAWTAPVQNGDHSSPAVSASGVYVSYACGWTYDFSPGSGAKLWTRPASCEGGGGKTPVLAAGRLYVRDNSCAAQSLGSPGVPGCGAAILDASSGSPQSLFSPTGPAPAVDATNVYDLHGSTLTATSVATGATAWTFNAGPSPVDPTIDSAPIVAGSTVIMGGSSGNIFGISTTDGHQRWEISAGAGMGIAAPDEQNVSQPLTGLASSGGYLVVPAGNTLTVYR
jgi:outer membrane protein assembly factor BamB